MPQTTISKRRLASSSLQRDALCGYVLIRSGEHMVGALSGGEEALIVEVAHTLQRPDEVLLASGMIGTGAASYGRVVCGHVEEVSPMRIVGSAHVFYRTAVEEDWHCIQLGRLQDHRRWEVVQAST
eukprot:5648098-Prymnesium_polylepis.2